MSVFSYYETPFYTIPEVQRLFDDFDRAWASNWSPSNRRQIQGSGEGNGNQSQVTTRSFQPRMDLHESPEQNVVTATFELPGLTKENVNIDIHNNALVVSGEVTTSNETNENGYVHRERKTGRFSRRVPLPAGTKPADINAKMDNGVLSVTFPKVSAEQAPQRITIA